MAKDMHLIISLYEEAEALYQQGKSEEAAEVLRFQYRFYMEEAELYGDIHGLSENYVQKGERLLAKIEGREYINYRLEERDVGNRSIGFTILVWSVFGVVVLSILAVLYGLYQWLFS
ncbi:hypothetical protein D5085_01150 [Ectothiorhodospiraceae bacterium BW-2]|nr:hypothetical protein D5085_01150 [Ectothiorhodospiraceae bacterium BW-2]